MANRVAMRTRTKRFGIAIALAMLAFMPIALMLIPQTDAVIMRPTLPQLETFTVALEAAKLNQERSAPPPSALVVVKVLVTNTGMEEKKDVLLRITLENTKGEVVAENIMLVYVPHLKTNAYTTNLMTREGGILKVHADVVSKGRVAVTEPSVLNISMFELLN